MSRYLNIESGWLERQKKDKNWRPDEYYENLLQRYKGNSRHGPLYQKCEEIGWEKCLRLVIESYYLQLEYNGWFSFDDAKKLDAGTYEIIDHDEDGISLVMKDWAWDTSIAWMNEYHLPKLSDGQYSKSHFELIEYVLEHTSPHWIVEMYVLFVICSDSARCYNLEWDYSK
jgi:hypothetical protein